MSKKAKTLSAKETKTILAALEIADIPHKAKAIAAIKNYHWIQTLIEKKQLTKSKIYGLFGYISEKWWRKKKEKSERKKPVLNRT